MFEASWDLNNIFEKYKQSMDNNTLKNILDCLDKVIKILGTKNCYADVQIDPLLEICHPQSTAMKCKV